MIHPSNLLRTHSEASRFTAPRQIGAGALYDETDCGLRQLPCFAKCLRLERAYTSTVFVICIAVLAALHACAAAYYVATAVIWRQNYHLSAPVAEWVLYIAAILGGSFALFLSYWGNVIHRPSYVGALAMLHAVAGWTLIVPELYHPNYYRLNSTEIASQQLCQARGFLNRYNETSDIYDEGKKYITLSIIIIYQLLHGLSFVSLIAHGISYLDDGCRKYAATTLICIIAISMQIGRLLGVNLTFIAVAFNRHIFFSFAWLIFMTGIFIIGFAVSLFPKYPKRTVIKFGVNYLLNPGSTLEDVKQQGFFSSLGAIFKSKFLMLNVFTAAVMHAALSNFRSLRIEFFRSRFIDTYEGIDYRPTYRNILQTTFVCAMLTIMAIAAAKKQAKTKFYVIWVAVAYAMVSLLFASYAFLKCEDQVSLHYKQLLQGCNAGCGCSMDTFAPVCLDGRTYYSACYAGCTIQGDNFYTNCYCGPSFQHQAKEGACNNEKCRLVALLAEGNTVITFGLHLSALLGHVILALNAVPDPKLKAVSLGVLLTVTLLLPFFPFRLLYEGIKTSLCSYILDGNCLLFKDSFPTTISAVTVVFMLVAVVFALCMLLFIKHVEEMRRNRPRSLGPRRTLPGNSIREEQEDEFEEGREMIALRTGDQLGSNQSQARCDTPISSSNDESHGSDRLIYQAHTKANGKEVNLPNDREDIKEVPHQINANGKSRNDRNLKKSEEGRPRPNSDISMQESVFSQVESEGYTDMDIDRELEEIEKQDQNKTKVLTRQAHVEETNF